MKASSQAILGQISLFLPKPAGITGISKTRLSAGVLFLLVVLWIEPRVEGKGRGGHGGPGGNRNRQIGPISGDSDSSDNPSDPIIPLRKKGKGQGNNDPRMVNMSAAARYGSMGSQAKYSHAAAVFRLQNTVYTALGGSSIRSAIDRPTKTLPESEDKIPIQPVQNSEALPIGNSGGRLYDPGYAFHHTLLIGLNGYISGYMLGRILNNRVSPCCTECSCLTDNTTMAWHLDAYVPFRFRPHYLEDLNITLPSLNITLGETTTTVSPNGSVAIQKSDELILQAVDMCMLSRWNRELPFTELPNMLLTFLVDDQVSGASIAEKARFLWDFLPNVTKAYRIEDSSSVIYNISSQFDQNALCVSKGQARTTDTPQPQTSTATPAPWYASAYAQWKTMTAGGDLGICGVPGIPKLPRCEIMTKNDLDPDVDPFFAGVRQLVRLYSSRSSTTEMLRVLTEAAKRCYPTDGVLVSNGSCWDLSLGTGQAQNLSKSASLFGNEEICERFLAPSFDDCIPSNSTSTCNHVDLLNIYVFARNYYLCPEPIDQSFFIKFANKYGNTYMWTKNATLDLSLPVSSSPRRNSYALLREGREYDEQGRIRCPNVLLLTVTADGRKPETGTAFQN